MLISCDDIDASEKNKNSKFKDSIVLKFEEKKWGGGKKHCIRKDFPIRSESKI